MDLFSKILATLWVYKNEKRAILTGCLWSQYWSNSKDGIIPKTYEKGTTGHSFCFIGQKTINGEPYLVARLSNGIEFGDKGLFYFPREVVNKECTFGNFYFADMPDGLTPEQIKEKSKYYRASWIKKILLLLIKWWNDIFL